MIAVSPWLASPHLSDDECYPGALRIGGDLLTLNDCLIQFRFCHEANVQTIPMGSGFLIGALQRQLDRHVRRGADHTEATVGVAVAHQGFQEQDEYLG